MREPTRVCYTLHCKDWEVIEKKPTSVTLHDDWMENRTRLHLVQGSFKIRSALRRNESEAKQKFNQLALRWYRETGMLSFIRQKAMHPAYQKIIGMGREALPFIFREMQNRRGDWFWALEALIEEEEQPPARHDNFNAAMAAWLKWGKDNGYL
jgi:hypothetical protein